jgi:hypothetical protein
MRLTFLKSGLLVTIGCLTMGLSAAWGQTYPGTQPGGSAWRGYLPETNWGGYAPGTTWRYYQPGTVPPGTVTAPPSTVLTPGGLVTPTQPGYVVVPQRRRLLNGIRYPVPGPTPYADGRQRPYKEYGTGRMVPLGKPWLPGAPGG